ncbi:7120_t:CDS:2 [Ambispora leptoticha]|uniref:7120_t:CDS:1 n=1 Tax=Ambispora leptoticha TaxID=144679 RepID=A0A9N8VCK8_9GLOM|nr:7120_t:CDS:2 [Ambispora leptoticha]
MRSVNVLLLVASLSLMVANVASQSSNLPGVLVGYPTSDQSFSCGGTMNVGILPGPDVISITTIQLGIAGVKGVPMDCTPTPGKPPMSYYSCKMPSTSDFCSGRSYDVAITSNNGKSTNAFNGQSATFTIGNPGNYGIVFTGPQLASVYKCSDTVNVTWTDPFNVYAGRTFSSFVLTVFDSQGNYHNPGNIPNTVGVLKVDQGYFTFKLNSVVPVTQARGYQFNAGIDGNIYTSPPFFIYDSC